MGTHNLINDQQMWAKVVTLGTNQAISQGLDNETWQNLKKTNTEPLCLGNQSNCLCFSWCHNCFCFVNITCKKTMPKQTFLELGIHSI